jgi:hypothetical protein
MAERELHDLPEDPEMESRLRSARPQPDNVFVSRLEGELFADARAPRQGTRRFGWRPTFAAGLAVAAIALLTLIFDLAGIGPFSDEKPVQAGDNCRTVVVTKRERTPVVVHLNGKDVVRFQMRPVKRHVKRCH